MVPEKREREYLAKLSLRAEEAVVFFSGKMKPERERSACAAFLRCLGIDFSPDDIVTSKEEPPDIIFDSASFELVEVLDEGRRRHKEMKDRAEQIKKSKTIKEVTEPYKSPKPISYAKIVELIVEALSKKSSRYGKDTCSKLDALVYIDLSDRFLDPKLPPSNLSELIEQGWRSVSMVFPPYSHVLFLANSEPKIFRRFEGQTKNKCENIDELFEL